MTVSHRKTKVPAKPDDRTTAAEPGVQYHCDVCEADITLTVRIRCAGGCKEFDLCGSCFCAGAEAKQHKAWHAYRIVEQHAYPIFAPDWGADEELLLIDGCQQYGLGNWADIADHIGNRTKEEVEEHYIHVFVQGRDGTEKGEKRAREADDADLADVSRISRQLPVRGPNMDYVPTISADAFHQAKRQRISDLRARQAALPIGSQKGPPPKPLVSAPTSHHELSGFMVGRLEFETEHEQDAENLVKDMEFGKVYRFGGELLPSEEQALGGKAVAGRSRMEASGRGGTSGRGTGAAGGAGASAKGSGGGDGGQEDDADKDDETEKPSQQPDDDDDMQESKDDDQTHDGDGDGDGEGEGNDVDDPADDEEKEDDDPAATTITKDSKGEGTQDAEAAAADAALPSSAAVEKEQPAEASDPPPADWDEDPVDCDLKLIILDMYNERLERRTERKRAILERGLVEVRRRQAAEKRRPKEDRDLLTRVRHFAQLMTPMDFEVFLDGLCYQDSLRRVLEQLREYRRAGLHNPHDAIAYEGEKMERARKAQQRAEDEYGGPIPVGMTGAAALASHKKGPSVVRRMGRESETPFGGDEEGGSKAATMPLVATAAPPKGSTDGAKATPGKANGGGKDASAAGKVDKNGVVKPPRKPPRPLDLSSNPSLHLLTRPEQVLCSVQRIQPSSFLIMKKEILNEYIRRSGKMSRRETRVLFSIDVNKIGKVYDLLEEQGYLHAAKNMGWHPGEEGVGTPPGWQDRSVVNGTAEAATANGATTPTPVQPLVPPMMNGRGGSAVGHSPYNHHQAPHVPLHHPLTSNGSDH